MTSKPSSASPEFPPSGRGNTHNTSQPASPSVSCSSPELPIGRCMFIATAEKRCGCHAFQRNPVLPGAYCDCGHQASYHCPKDGMPPPPPPPPPVPPFSMPDPTICTSPSHATLLQRLHHLETTHALDRKHWEKELRHERHSRQEDIRTLRETMSAFFRVIERDIPRQFADVEDKIENLVDHHQRLREKVISVDDFSMAMEDRVIDLEQQQAEPRRAKGRERGIRQGHDGEVRVDSNVQTESRNHEFDWHLPIKEEPRESNNPSTSNISGDSQQGFPQVPQVPQANEETNSNPKDSTSVKRKRSVRIPLPNPPPLFLSE
ncbi:uncharacterized protein TRUGW13939_03655 [Talaromyces rugulosus]|uniref:Uncharacterized protein n=1 Tax=Talaromyces rugulosus TaxID=121627 RepID=A0A7H8QRF9_TALRU|nr:uncharacterized protein TRUGW13939_03655 [Talaromyces rugulosus]QKX56550.1 hypothetical protein TRUGW13939_03655 [Talaromyces rugulosus]